MAKFFLSLSFFLSFLLQAQAADTSPTKVDPDIREYALDKVVFHPPLFNFIDDSYEEWKVKPESTFAAWLGPKLAEAIKNQNLKISEAGKNRLKLKFDSLPLRSEKDANEKVKDLGRKFSLYFHVFSEEVAKSQKKDGKVPDFDILLSTFINMSRIAQGALFISLKLEEVKAEDLTRNQRQWTNVFDGIRTLIDVGAAATIFSVIYTSAKLNVVPEFSMDLPTTEIVISLATLAGITAAEIVMPKLILEKPGQIVKNREIKNPLYRLPKTSASVFATFLEHTGMKLNQAQFLESFNTAGKVFSDAAMNCVQALKAQDPNQA